MFQAVGELAESDVAEMAVGRGQIHLGCSLHHLLTLEAVGDEVTDGDDADAVFGGHLLQLRHTGHGAVGIQNLDECGGGL